MNKKAYAFGEFLGRKLIEAAESSESKSEGILYLVSDALISARKTFQKIPDELERYFTIRDVKLGIDATIATEIKAKNHQTIKGSYQKLLHKLDLRETI